MGSKALDWAVSAAPLQKAAKRAAEALGRLLGGLEFCDLWRERPELLIPQFSPVVA